MANRHFISLSLLLLLTGVVFVYPTFAQAQESLTLEVHPPLFQLTISPGGTWRSQVRVVNPNPYPVTIRLRAVDFEPEGEDGGGRFVEREPGFETSGYAAASWLDVPEDLVRIEQEQSVTLPVSLAVPLAAEPGTHAVAIIIGTVPVGTAPGETAVSANITSLVVMRVLGEVREEGFIREFVASQRTYQESTVPISLRFENTGNVHLEPRGEIVIENLWGRERGRIPLNRTTDFTTVLPDAVRRFDFTWEGERGVFEVGPYRATATIAFGDEHPQTVSAETRFWIIPTKPLAVVAAGVLFFIASLLLLVRSLVQRTIARGELTRRKVPLGSLPPEALRPGVVDLRATLDGVGRPAPLRPMQTVMPRSILARLLPWVMVGGFVLGTSAIGFYVRDSLTGARGFTVTLPQEGGEARRLTPEELAEEPPLDVSGETIRQGAAEIVYELDVAVLNGSGIAGVAKDFADRISQLGYTVGEVGNAETFGYSRTEIRYIPGAGDVVEQITALLPVSPVIIEDPTLTEAQVVVIVGSDL